MIRLLSAAARTLPLFRDVAPTLVPPRPRLVEPRGQLALFPLPAPLPRPRVVLADPRQGQLFPGMLPVAPVVARPRLRLVPGQLLLPTGEPLRTPDGKRRLVLVPEPLLDLHHESLGDCLGQAEGCPFESCRHHLGAEQEKYGVVWSCSLTLASAVRQFERPRGQLPPGEVARMDGLTEREVQSTEKKLFLRLRRELRSGRRPDLEDWFDAMFSDDPDGACED